MKHLIFDDTRIVCRGMRHLNCRSEGLAACGEADSPRDAILMIEQRKPDMVIVDTGRSVADGIALVRKIRDRFSLPILVVSSRDENLWAERALQAGATGYVMKEQPLETLVLAILTVLRGHIYLSDRMKSLKLRAFSEEWRIDHGREWMALSGMQQART